MRELSASPRGHYDIELYFQSDAADGSLSDIVYAFERFGFDVGEILVTDLVTGAVQGAVLGGIGGGTVGALTKDVGAALITTIAGSLIGAIFGSLREQAAARHHARRVYGSWHVAPLAPGQTWAPFA
ncbi:MAG: hypothetical protein M3Z65_00625 [Chloroflexota bacterium]|nr:hypothetical protein [Chloroflexota bacterium]